MKPHENTTDNTRNQDKAANPKDPATTDKQLDEDILTNHNPVKHPEKENERPNGDLPK